MPPPRMFQRRRRQLFALMGQPLFPFLAVLLAAQGCSAQPHARENHAQHIMNQARANQKASRPVCNSRVGRGERRHRAVKDVASMAHGAPTSVTNAGARSSSASGNVENTKKEKKRPGPTT